MTPTVPISLGYCTDLRFFYDHAVHGVSTRDCVAYFREELLEHTLKLRAQQTPGCKSYSSVMQFKPYSRPPGQSMWTNYAPNDITVSESMTVMQSTNVEESTFEHSL